ncbi:MAG: glycosyltransferase [Verrucomicrobiales bacterium]
MHLLIIHYHWRPGGVRQVVETTLAQLAQDPAMDLRGVVLASGEPPPAAWAQHVQSMVGPSLPLKWVSDRWLSYTASWPGPPAQSRAATTSVIAQLLGGLPLPRAVLVENPAVGRHPTLGRAAAEACAATGTRLVCRHHDFFFDGRWERWPDMIACGLSSVEEAIDHAIPPGDEVDHVAVSARDAAWLSAIRRVSFVPNPAAPPPGVSADEVASARNWLESAAGVDRHQPIWLCPTRVLRRKNLVEAVLLARLVNPQIPVLVTGTVSSPEESFYGEVLARLGDASISALKLGILATSPAGSFHPPRMPVVMAAADRLVVTSLFEGFGLPAAEASALERPMLARRAACPDGHAPAGVDAYDELQLPWDLVGEDSERARQAAAWRQHRSRLPPDWAIHLAEPPWWEYGHSVAFSRLTLAGQIHAWTACLDPHQAATVRAHNPWLANLGARARFHGHAADLSPPTDGLPPVPLAAILAGCRSAPVTRSYRETSLSPAMLRSRLPWANYYPLLWPGGAGVAP